MKKLIVFVLLTAFIASCSDSDRLDDVQEATLGDYKNSNNVQYFDQVFEEVITKSGERIYEGKNSLGQSNTLITQGLHEGAAGSNVLNSEVYKFHNAVLIRDKSTNKMKLRYFDAQPDKFKGAVVKSIRRINMDMDEVEVIKGLGYIDGPIPFEKNFQHTFTSLQSAFQSLDGPVSHAKSQSEADCDDCLYGGHGSSECSAPTVIGEGSVTCSPGYYACCNLWSANCCYDGTTGVPPPADGGSAGGGATTGDGQYSICITTIIYGEGFIIVVETCYPL